MLVRTAPIVSAMELIEKKGTGYFLGKSSLSPFLDRAATRLVAGNLLFENLTCSAACPKVYRGECRVMIECYVVDKIVGIGRGFAI